MKRAIIAVAFTISTVIFSVGGLRADPPLVASYVDTDLSKPVNEGIWNKAVEQTVPLMGQPMALPRPQTTTTTAVKVKAIHDGRLISFRISWPDTERNEGGHLGEFSDAVALEFPVRDNEAPPPIFMGMKGDPVHIFHWRAQYQADLEHGKPLVKDLYPNMQVDMYPLEPKDPGSMPPQDEASREVYSPARAVGNPQSYAKSGVDQILAEGFGTSAVIENGGATGTGVWANGEWTVVITRPLVLEKGSILAPGKSSFVGFAVWQGSKDEVGSRKSVTMSWVPINLDEASLREVSNAQAP